MAYQISKTQPQPRASSLAWEQRGPGLYDDGEVLVELDDIHATVSVKHEWLDHHGGIGFIGTARWCDADGQTHLCPDGKHVETFVSVSVDPVKVTEHGLDALKTDVLLLLMGEEPRCHDGEAPVINLPLTTRLAASIRHAASTVDGLKKSATPVQLLS